MINGSATARKPAAAVFVFYSRPGGAKDFCKMPFWLYVSTTLTSEIRQPRHAVMTADTLSFSRADKMLGIQRSSLSRLVQSLEDRLGVQLVERTRRGTMPTENCKAFLTVARRILTDVEICWRPRAASVSLKGGTTVKVSTAFTPVRPTLAQIRRLTNPKLAAQACNGRAFACM